MIIKTKEILDKDNIGGHIVLETLCDYRDILKVINEKGEAEIRIFVNEIECDAEALIKHWQNTMYKCIEDAAKDMIDDKILEINTALETIREKALDTMGINPW